MDIQCQPPNASSSVCHTVSWNCGSFLIILSMVPNEVQVHFQPPVQRDQKPGEKSHWALEPMPPDYLGLSNRQGHRFHW
ncbi:Complement C3, partial [Manis pentadactyla]